MKKEENIRSGKDIKKEPELIYEMAKSISELWAQYNTARVQGYHAIAERALNEIKRLEKEIEGE